MNEALAPSDASIELVEESINVTKAVKEIGHVTVRTVIDHEDVMVRDLLSRELVEVERVAIGQPVDVAPSQRQEGEYLVIPIVEERLVVEKRLFLVEEIRIRRSTVAIPVEVPITRRVMRAIVERDAPVAPTPEEARP